MVVNSIRNYDRLCKEMKCLLIGPGVSAIEHQDYAQFNTFDIKVGCREILWDSDWYPLDWIASPQINDTKWILTTYPELKDKVITQDLTALRLGHTNKIPVPTSRHDNVYSLQIRIAIELGATDITTIGWDILSNDLRTAEDQRYRLDFPIQSHIIGKEVQLDRISRYRGAIQPLLNNYPNLFTHRGITIMPYQSTNRRYTIKEHEKLKKQYSMKQHVE